jgi:hypothetical protein
MLLRTCRQLPESNRSKEDNPFETTLLAVDSEKTTVELLKMVLQLYNASGCWFKSNIKNSELYRVLRSDHFEQSRPLICASVRLLRWFQAAGNLDNDELCKFEQVCYALHVAVFKRVMERLSAKPGSKQALNTCLELETYKFSLTDSFADLFGQLPSTLSKDRLGFVWVLDCVASLQQKWVMTFFWQRAKIYQSQLPKPVVDEHSEVQRFVGFAIQGCLKKWRERTRGSARKADADGEEIERSRMIVAMLERMRILRDEAILDEDYVSNYYTKREEIMNEGGRSLVSKTMFPWAILLMKAIRKNFDRSQLEGEGKVAVQRALKLVGKERIVAQTFKACVKKLEGDVTEGGALSESDLEQLHDKLLKKSFHSRIEVVFKDFKEDALNNQAGATKVDLRVKLLAANELANSTKKGVSKVAPAPLEGDRNVKHASVEHADEHAELMLEEEYVLGPAYDSDDSYLGGL